MRKSVATKRTKVVKCVVCGKPYTVGANSRKVFRCTDCGVEVMAKNAREISEKSGEGYTRWQDGIRKALERGY